MKKKTMVLMGAGRYGRPIAQAVKEGKLPAYELLAVFGRTPERTGEVAAICGCPAITDIADVLALKPDYVVEAASIAAVREHLPAILRAGIDFVPISIGVFADEAFLAECKELAAENDAKIYFPAGAIGGFDILTTIASEEDAAMEFSMIKHKERLKDTPLYDKSPNTGEPVRVFDGTATEAIELLPRNVNIAVAAALATVGPDRMRVTIDCDPEEPSERIHMFAKNSYAEADIRIASNPRELVPRSVVTFLNNLASPVQFG